MSRIIGIRHRIKRTSDGEARPTQVAILSDGKKSKIIDLPDEQAEIDFLNGVYPLKWGTFPASEIDLSQFRSHHVVIENEDEVKVPTEYIGYTSGDCVAMILGGSGDYFAFSLSLHGEKIGAKVYRIPPAKLKAEREAKNPSVKTPAPTDKNSNQDSEEIVSVSKDTDALLLAELFHEKPDLFMETVSRDRDTIRLKMNYIALTEARKLRIACQQRIRQRLIGQIHCTPELYEAGALETAMKDAVANSAILNLLIKEEEKCTKSVEEALDFFPIYTEVLSKIKGTGPKTMARILAHVGDVRRFETIAKFKAYCGVHLVSRQATNSEDTMHSVFPRRERGHLSNWQPDCRQGFYLLVQYWMKSKDSEWGQKFLAYKEHFRTRHPEVVTVGKRKLYTKGHIHQMATHRTMTRFAEWMYREWVKLETQVPAHQK